MNGATRSRQGKNALRRRCPRCKKLRKFCEPPGDVGGELHPRRPRWKTVDNVWVCGWCVDRPGALKAIEAARQA